MIALKRRLKVIKITEEQYQYYTRWYHPVVRSLVSKIDFQNDYSLLAKMLLPAITQAEARKSVNLLKRLGFIKQRENWKWIQISSALSTGDEVSSLNVVNYHKQVSKLAEDAFDRCSKDLRDISALTLGINKSDFKKIKARIQEFRKEIMDIAKNSENDDRVYQLNFQFFPVSKSREE